MHLIVRRSPMITVAQILFIISAGCQHQDVSSPVAEKTSTAPAQVSPVEPVNEEVPFALEERFELLTRDHFEAFGAESETWSETVEGIVCSGKPRGYLYS